MEIVSIEKKTFEEMKERFGCFSRHVKELRPLPPAREDELDGRGGRVRETGDQ